MEANSPAKINLFLNVVGRREDGYHNLESLFAPIDLNDKVTIHSANELSCTVDNATIDNNIALKAAHLLKEKYGVAKGCKIHIEKHIPLGAGLGGGSSNAATTLKLLSNLWELNLPNEELKKIAIQLGADVPFFLDPKPSFITGIGENIIHVNLALELPILIVMPDIHSVTADVFKKGFENYSAPIDRNNLTSEIFNGRNDTYQNALNYEPEISQTLDWLNERANLKVARMSGTGSTCFGIFRTLTDAKAAQKLIPTNWKSHSELLAL